MGIFNEAGSSGGNETDGTGARLSQVRVDSRRKHGSARSERNYKEPCMFYDEIGLLNLSPSGIGRKAVIGALFFHSDEFQSSFGSRYMAFCTVGSSIRHSSSAKAVLGCGTYSASF